MVANLHNRPDKSKQLVLFPDRIDRDIAPDAPVRVIDSVVDRLNLDCLSKVYKSRGRRAYNARVMLKVITYAYMNNVYSCRRIEELLKRDIHFIWLAGYEQPDFITINRFRNRVKDEINNIFTQLVLILAERGFVTLEVEYIDGTKIESKANKYTFVWRKTVEKNRAKLMEKIRALLEQVDESIAQDNATETEKVEFTPETLTDMAEELKQALEAKPEAKTKEEKTAHREAKKRLKEMEACRDKLAEYDGRLEQMGERNSMSKTDPDATFMRMKEDAMNNGQTKPGYNLQISAENQFITDFALFPNPADTLTMIPFLSSFLSRYGHLTRTAVADSGYGSEENYRFMEEAGMDAYVKYNRFHIEHRPRYKADPFRSDSFYYNEDEDYFVCPMGQHLDRIGTAHSTTASGYRSEVARYRAKRCEGCPLRCRCLKSKASRRTIEVNHRLNRYKKKASELLTSEEGVRHRGRRCVEPEAVFGQMKTDMAYKRFRHFGKDKVTMDFAFFAIAFNLKKMCARITKNTQNDGKGGFTPSQSLIFVILSPIMSAIFNRMRPAKKLVA